MLEAKRWDESMWGSREVMFSMGLMRKGFGRGQAHVNVASLAGEEPKGVVRAGVELP